MSGQWEVVSGEDNTSPAATSARLVPKVFWPVNFNWRVAVILGICAFLSLFFEVFLYKHFSRPLLEERFGKDKIVFYRDISKDSGRFIYAVIIAPFLEEFTFRLPFAAGFTSLILFIRRARRKKDRDEYKSGIASLIWLLIPVFLFSFPVFLLPLIGINKIDIFISLTLLANIILVFVMSAIFCFGYISRYLYTILGIISIFMFSCMHITNYTSYPHSIESLLLVIPQLMGGILFYIVAGKYNLSASIFCHMLTNALLFFPPVIWLFNRI